MALSWPRKDPDEVLDYQLDWTERLAGDPIVTSSWDVPGGLIKDSDLFSDTAAIIWIRGGTDGESYTVTNTITTTGGRTMEQSVTLPVRDR